MSSDIVKSQEMGPKRWTINTHDVNENPRGLGSVDVTNQLPGHYLLLARNLDSIATESIFDLYSF